MSKGNSAEARALIEKAQGLLEQALGMLGGESATDAKPKQKAKAASAAKAKPAQVDFTTPIRPFVKRHAADMNGARKFALLVAHLAQGDETKAIQLSDVESHWNKMTDKSLLGMKFNRLYTSEAKNNDWVHSPAKGVYHLRPAWKEIFE